MVRVEQVLESWKTIRNDTALAVEEMPAAELDYRPAADFDTFRQIARHVLDATDGLTGLLLAGEEDFSTPAFRARMRDHLRTLPGDCGGPELAAALRQSIADRATALGAQPADFFAHIVKRFDGQAVTRLEMLLSIRDHELGHRQQLFVFLRLNGIVPATTRRRLAKQAGK